MNPEIEKILSQCNGDELKEIIAHCGNLLKQHSKKEFFEITLTANPYKGSGKCWIQQLVDGARKEFVAPYSINKNGYKISKTFRLPTGTYLVNDEGSKSRDNRYTLTVHEDFSTTISK